MTRRQLADEQWKLIEPFLPIGEYGPYPERLRDQFEGVIWRFRTSSQWREMPGEFGPWPTVYGRFRVWRDAGVFTALLEGSLGSSGARQLRERTPSSQARSVGEIIELRRHVHPDRDREAAQSPPKPPRGTPRTSSRIFESARNAGKPWGIDHEVT